MMLFGADELRELLQQLAVARNIVARVDITVLEAATTQAEELAAGRTEDEPAAIFAALARRSRALGPLARDGIPAIAHAFAMGRGFRLDADIELDILRARILYGAITFDELRAVFASMRRPFGEGSESPAPRRPR